MPCEEASNLQLCMYMHIHEIGLAVPGGEGLQEDGEEQGAESRGRGGDIGS